MSKYLGLISFFIFFIAFSTNAQDDIDLEEKPSIISINDTTQSQPAKRLELLQAGELEGDVLPSGEKVRIVRKDASGQVKFKQDQTVMYADSVFQYLGSNRIEAFGNIKFVEKDSLTLTGDTLYYDGFSKLARLRGNVVMQDQEKTVRTRKLNYNLKNKIAYYFEGGVVQDQTSRLTSDRGYYNTDTRIATFGGNVRAISPSQRVESDSLTYSTVTGTVFFDKDAKIYTPDGTIDAGAGTQYNTQTRTMKSPKNNRSRTRIENRDYIISGNSVDYDNLTEKGVAKKNVQLYYKKENVTIFGDEAYYDGLENKLDVYGSALLVKPFRTDTLYISADTLIAMNDSVATERRFYAYRNVKIFKKDIQGRCDSLNYNLDDSVIYFEYDPVLWNNANQLSGTKIRAKLVNNTIDSLVINDKAFVVSEDYFGQFNQIKGRDLLAQFDSGYIKRVDVEGNGESIYYILEESSNKEPLLKGMNYIKCSSIILSFEMDNVLEEIMFLQQPEGKVIPPQMITKENSELKNFSWRIDERPTYEMIMQDRNLEEAAKNTYQSKNKEGELIIDKKFKVYYDEAKNQLIYSNQNPTQAAIETPFVLWVYPQNKSDLKTEEEQKNGFVSVPFFLEEEIINPDVPFRYVRPLPDIKIRKIITGQFVEGAGFEWKGSYELNQN